jgi:putative endonuclease
MKIAHNYYVYIVECNDGIYYTGVTNDIERRIAEHNDGDNPTCFTYKRQWSRKKKEALFIEDWEEIKILSRSKPLTNPSSTSSD